MTPNKENIQKWVDALRSGDYIQAKGVLRRPGDFHPTYCCLGVACDISGLGTWKRTFDEEEYLGEEAVLPTEVMNWLGIDQRNPWVAASETPYIVKALAELNDTHGWDFNQIADVIERTWLNG